MPQKRKLNLTQRLKDFDVRVALGKLVHNLKASFAVVVSLGSYLLQVVLSLGQLEVGSF